MANMKVTYMNTKSGHGNMADKHTFVKCKKCGAKFVTEKYKGVCPVCGGKGVDPSSKAVFAKAEEKAKAKADAKIQAEVDADNAEEAKSKK